MNFGRMGAGFGRLGSRGSAVPTAPAGFILLVDSDGYFLVDCDGYYLAEPI